MKKNNKKKIALFPVKCQPPHLGHILTLIKLMPKYDRIIISILNINLFIKPVEIKKMLQTVLENFDYCFGFHYHIESFTTSTTFKDLPDFDVVVTGNRRVYKNCLKHKIKAELIKRTPYYKGEDIRNGC